MHELDIKCAKALGYTIDQSKCSVCGWDYEGPFARGCTPNKCETPTSEVFTQTRVPRFSSNETAARLLKNEVEKSGLQAEYVFALAELCFGTQDEWGTAHVFKMMHATPEQRARAFLEAVKG